MVVARRLQEAKRHFKELLINGGARQNLDSKKNFACIIANCRYICSGAHNLSANSRAAKHARHIVAEVIMTEPIRT